MQYNLIITTHTQAGLDCRRRLELELQNRGLVNDGEDFGIGDEIDSSTFYHFNNVAYINDVREILQRYPDWRTYLTRDEGNVHEVIQL